jgi:hypothetical protein
MPNDRMSKRPMPARKGRPGVKQAMPRRTGEEGMKRPMPRKTATKRMTPQEQRLEALRRKRGRMLGVEGPKGPSDKAKANRQAKAEYIRKTPRGDGARLKPGKTPARPHMNSGKKK